MIKKVLVPLDGSELAERALEPAFEIARAGRGEVILLSVPVYQPIMAPSAANYGLAVPEPVSDVDREKVEKYLQAVKETRKHLAGAMDTVVREGDVAGNIVDLAVERGVDLIVMTTHGYSGFTRWMLGSITERVLRSAPCPVLVMRCAEPLENMVIALDGSPLAEQALAPGVELAKIFGARVTLLRVDEEAKMGGLEMSLLSLAGTDLRRQVAQESGRCLTHYLEAHANRLYDPKLEIDTAVVSGSPAQGILEYIEAHPVDLLVMATHGRTGLRRWVYGSVTQKCLHNTACAMLIVRPPADSLN